MMTIGKKGFGDAGPSTREYKYSQEISQMVS
jgi:hypothetical protein